MDEILFIGKRSDKENEASLRIKTEFLVRLEGVCDEPSRKDGEAQELILVIGATNRYLITCFEMLYFASQA